MYVDGWLSPQLWLSALSSIGVFCFTCWFSLALDHSGRQKLWPSMHSILKWPLLVLAALVLVVVLVLYMATRALIAGLEWLFVSSATRRLRMSLEEADSFEAYKAAAGALDEANDLNAWKAQPSSRFYASQILSSALFELGKARYAQDWHQLLQTLQRSLREVNFAGHLTEALYAKSFYGTKYLIDGYCNTVVNVLDALREEVAAHVLQSEEELQCGVENGAASCGQGSLLEEARRFTEFAICTFGRSSLCLSGGGGMAFQHFGVLHELFRLGLLPKVISGTSGGAAVACYVCCRTDAELRGDVARGKYPLKLDPDEIQPGVTLWPGTWLDCARHYYDHGCIFAREPVERWADEWALGDTTFLEAYTRTGRVLNITTCIVGGESDEQVPLLLNYQTHPHVLISSAVICSGSMPNLLNPSKLFEKCPKTGSIQVHSHSELCYADGSIDFDIPLLSLAQAFGVRYTVAVQVNPHVTPFIFPPHGDAGRPTTRIVWSQGHWRGGFVLCAIELILKETFRTLWKVMGLLKLLPPVFGAKWDLFFSQTNEGSVTLCTDRGYHWKVMHALSNPSQDDFRYWWHEGQLMAWQKMSLLEKRLRVERSLFNLDSVLESTPTSTKRKMPAAITPTGLSVRKRRSFLVGNATDN